MTKVYTVLNSGNVYTKEWVYKIRDSLKKYSSVPFDFFCLTNEELPKIQTISLQYPLSGWWSKLELCRPDIKGTVHYIDLDTIIVGNVDFFLREQESLLFKDWIHSDQKESAMLILDEERRTKVWEFFSKDMNKHTFDFFGDGRIFNHCIGEEVRTIQEKHPNKIHVWKSLKNESIPLGCKIICFSGIPKPKDFADNHWVKQFYW